MEIFFFSPRNLRISNRPIATFLSHISRDLYLLHWGDFPSSSPYGLPLWPDARDW